MSGKNPYTLEVNPVSFVIINKHCQQETQRINRQINWGLKVCYMRRNFNHCSDVFLKSHVLPAELIISKFRILKLHTELNQRIVSEIFEKCVNRPQLKEQTDKTAYNKNANVY